MKDDRLISLNAAIDALNKRWRTCIIGESLIRDAKDTLKALPSATDTNVGGNLIDRQAALDAMETWDKFGCDPDGKLVRYDDDKHYIPYVHYEDMVHAIKHLPPAQPEIIRCKDCKWYGRVDKRRFYRGMDCLQKHIDTIVPDRDFCSKAERRGEQDG